MIFWMDNEYVHDKNNIGDLFYDIDGSKSSFLIN